VLKRSARRTIATFFYRKDARKSSLVKEQGDTYRVQMNVVPIGTSIGKRVLQYWCVHPYQQSSSTSGQAVKRSNNEVVESTSSPLHTTTYGLRRIVNTQAVLVE